MFIALSLIALGILYLLKNLEIISGGVWHILWPTIIIIFGLSIVFKKRKREHWWDFFENSTKEDWEHWGREFGRRMEEWGKNLEKKYQDHPNEWEDQFGRKIGNKIKQFFE